MYLLISTLFARNPDPDNPIEEKYLYQQDDVFAIEAKADDPTFSANPNNQPGYIVVSGFPAQNEESMIADFYNALFDYEFPDDRICFFQLVRSRLTAAQLFALETYRIVNITHAELASQYLICRKVIADWDAPGTDTAGAPLTI